MHSNVILIMHSSHAFRCSRTRIVIVFWNYRYQLIEIFLQLLLFH